MDRREKIKLKSLAISRQMHCDRRGERLYVAPFYGESSMVMYRKDLMEKAGLSMPDAPTRDFIGKAARAMTEKDICLRGKGDAFSFHVWRYCYLCAGRRWVIIDSTDIPVSRNLLEI